MAEVVDRPGPDGEGGGGVATEIPSRHLQGVPYKDLPEPLPLRAVVGPSVILLATSIGSGEYVLWPFITSQVGLVAMWMAIVGVFTQYFINMEIERYTLATAETAVTGFTRLWRPWGVIMAVAALASWGFPGWAAGASTSLTYVFGWSVDSVPWITVAALVAIGISLTASPVVYQMVEKAQMVMVALIVAFLVLAVFLGVEGGAYTDLVKSNPRKRRRAYAPGYLAGTLAVSVGAARARPGSVAWSGRPRPAARRAARPGRPGRAAGPRSRPRCGRRHSGGG